MGEDVIEQLTYVLRGDYTLSSNKAAYIDLVAIAPTELQSALITSRIISGGVVQADGLANAQYLIEERGAFVAKAMLSAPEILERFTARQNDHLKGLDEQLFSNQGFLDSKHFGEFQNSGMLDRIIQAMYLMGDHIQPTHDALGNINGLNYDPDDLARAMDDKGIHPGWEVHFDGKIHDPNLVEYCKIVTSEQNRLREMIKTYAGLAASSNYGLSIVPLAERTAQDFDEGWFYSRNSNACAGSTAVAFGPSNTSLMTVAKDAEGEVLKLADGSGRHLNSFNLAIFAGETYGHKVSPGASPEQTAIEANSAMFQDKLFHTTGTNHFVPTYQNLYPQNPANPPASLVIRGGFGGSGTSTSALDALLTARGVKAIKGNFLLNVLVVEFIDETGELVRAFAEGNSLLHRVSSKLTPCQTFTTNVEEIGVYRLTGPSNMYPSALCQ